VKILSPSVSVATTTTRYFTAVSGLFRGGYANNEMIAFDLGTGQSCLDLRFETVSLW
jgi:hypothetical protein